MSAIRHYLLLTFPLEFLSIVLLAFAGGATAARRTLAVLVASNLLISGSFLQYIGNNGGAPGADYGIAYSRQVR